MPFLFLALYIATVMIRPHEFVSFLEGFPLPLILEMITVLFFAAGKKRFDAVQIRAVLLLNLCIAISWLTLSISMGVSISMQFFANQTLMLILIANIVDTSAKHRIILSIIVISAVVMSIHGFLQIAAEDKIGWTGVTAMVRHDSGSVPIWQARYTGPFKDPNDMGMLLACSFPLAFYLWIQRKNILSGSVWLLAVGMTLYGVYLANSRGTMLASVAPLLLYLAFKYNVAKMLVPIAFLIPILLAVLPSRMLISNDESSQQRIEAWYQGYLMFKSNPLFGVGMNAFVDHHHKTAHNSWVLAYAELGFIGFYFWMLMIFCSVYMLFYFSTLALNKNALSSLEGDRVKVETLKTESGLATATFYSLVGILVSAFFLSRTYSFLIYMFCGLAASSFYRMQVLLPNHPPHNIKGRIMILSILSIIMIALLVMFKS